MKVIILPEVYDYFEKLVETLYQREYFGFQESSFNYVMGLVEEIENNLPKLQHKRATKYFDQYGKSMFYASFRKNKQTEWYAFFSKYIEDGNTGYLVRHIENNHTAAQYF